MNDALERLKDYFSRTGPVAVCFSGGVDSGVLLWAASRFAPSTLALTAVSPLKDPAVLENASRFAASLGVTHVTFNTNELSDEQFRRDPQMRCYICKRILYRKALDEAKKRGFQLIADGTNLTDLSDHRPGIKAAEEFGVLSPFLDAGISKTEIIAIKKQFELNLPETPTTCIATRFIKGEIDESLFPWIRKMESFLTEKGFTRVRARIAGKKIILQVKPEQVSSLKKIYQLVEYPTGYKLEIDERGYRPAGSMIGNGGD